MALSSPSDIVRARLVAGVRAVFNDTDKGEEPVPVADGDALFERDSPIRMVHADVVSMMIGGVRSLLLQMLHPHALQGVLDHSNFRADMHGRLRRTARFMAVTTFGHRDAANATITQVNRIHRQVKGTLPDGTPYAATNPETLAWVHVAGATSFLESYLKYVRPGMPMAEQDRYYNQFAAIARKLGADPVPTSRREAETLVRDMRPVLASSPEAREVADLVLRQRPQGAPPAAQALIGTAATDLLPPYARTMLGLRTPGLAAIPTRLAMRSAGKTLRWAFKQ